MKTLVVNDEVVKEQTEINKDLHSFYQFFFSKNNEICRQKVLQYLEGKSLPKLDDDECALSEKDIIEEEVKRELNKMEISKSLETTFSQKNSMKLFGITLKFLFFCYLKWLF